MSIFQIDRYCQKAFTLVSVDLKNRFLWKIPGAQMSDLMGNKLNSLMVQDGILQLTVCANMLKKC